MSLKINRSGALQSWLFFIACIVLFVWYANPQILYTLVFPYQVIKAVFPGLLPDLSALAP